MKPILPRILAILLFFSTAAFAASSQNVVPNEKDPGHTLYCQERTAAASNLMTQWVLKVSKEDFWKYHKIEEATPEVKKELEEYIDRAYSHKTDRNAALAFRTEEWERCWVGKGWEK